MTLISVYSRHFKIEQDEHNSLKEAIQFLSSLETEEQGYARGIYDAKTKMIYIPSDLGIGDTRDKAIDDVTKQANFSPSEITVHEIEI